MFVEFVAPGQAELDITHQITDICQEEDTFPRRTCFSNMRTSKFACKLFAREMGILSRKIPENASNVLEFRCKNGRALVLFSRTSNSPPHFLLLISFAIDSRL